MLTFDFMRRALIIGLLLGAVIPTLGVVVINRKTSMISDALSHVSLNGVALGLILGINPVIGAIVFSIGAALTLDAIRNRMPQNGDLATAVIMSSGIGMASILSDFVPGSMRFESFLFGSIVSIPDGEFVLILILALVILISSFVLYHPILSISIDPVTARLTGLPVKAIDTAFTIILSLSIAIASRTVGALMVSSLFVLPVAGAMMHTRSYRTTMLAASFLGALGTFSGISLSYYLNLKPGGAIVMACVILFVVSALFAKRKAP